jgi:hypothetical protein
MRTPWHRKAEPPPPVYVGSHEDRLTRIPPLHVDPDDDAPTREDHERAEEHRHAFRYGARRPDR